jgi:integrating conjugative element protein (TIGR03749 family)
MKRFAASAAASALLFFGWMPISQAVQVLRWERMPLPVSLVVGQERVVFIDRAVRVGVPTHVGGQLRVQSAGGALYLRASEPLAPTRLQLQDVESGALILLDVAAEPAKPDQAPLEPLRIVQGSASARIRGDTTSTVDDGASTFAVKPTDEAPVARQTPIPVVLTRHAAQNLYAPLRTVEPVAGLARVNLRRGLALDTLLPTLPVRAHSLAAWRLEDQWVTAIRLSNTSTRWLDLDPRALQGDFVAATFQHPNLGPLGTSSDTTVLYLVTRGHGLAESLLPVISAIDASVNLPPAGAAGTRSGARHEK